VSVVFYDELFILKGHIHMVRDKLMATESPINRAV
jgi:hypothetical protein